ncbi:tetratricopeptide repeat-containing sensor histidine kinase [Yeosuana sp.]|uniref:tetratricopeptide repeat-containing sensor histidine kinase n=1 Tax=Yeosuana sp. TaxID=2529388 RepID=UPI004054A9BC
MNLNKFILIFLLISPGLSWSQTNTRVQLDSFAYYVTQSKNNTDNNVNTRLSYALKAKKIANKLALDSLTIQSNFNVSELQLDSGYNDLFLKTIRENLILATQIKDTSSMALIYEKLAYYYRQSTDSAYYYYHKSEKLYRALKDNYYTANMLLNIAIIQKNEKDFTGSEVTSVEGINLLEDVKPDKKATHNNINRTKAFFYNNLGAVFGELEQFDESINYHKKAIVLKRKLDGDNKATIENSLNNLALAYKNSGQYDLALENYNQILKNENLINERPAVYATILDNYANTLYLLKDRNQLPALYFKALKICDSINASYNTIIINQHLAEYYYDAHKLDSAKYYAYKAKDIAQNYHNDDLLKSLLLLSKIEDDTIAVKHFNAYIKLNDSLQKNERSIRNKFARIRFETKEIEQTNKRITREKIWLLFISVALLLAALLIYVIISQQSKNKELRFIQDQQVANEEIYNLMLSQNEKIEEARVLEKKNISQELHDGVLGRLFGARLSLDSLNKSSSEEAIKIRSKYIQELISIETDIRKVSHELNTDFISGSGFLDIIKTLLETQTKAYKLKYKLDYNGSIHWEDVSNKKKIHIYRILQESLHNIYKHANATIIKIGFSLKNNVICLTIEDDGDGFDVNKAKTGIGLKNINARVDEIKGKIQITSEKDLGTTVKIYVPI